MKDVNKLRQSGFSLNSFNPIVNNIPNTKRMKVKKSYTIDPDVAEGVKRLAEKEGRKESQMVNRILKKRLTITEAENNKNQNNYENRN